MEEKEQKKYPWMIESCPFCQNRMYVLEVRPKQNKRTEQQYLETKSCCPSCDFWHITSVPYAIARSVDPNLWLPTPEEIDKLVQKQKEQPVQV
jgi:hypothetical protein